MTDINRPLRLIAIFVLLALAACTPATDETTLKVIATDPGTESILGPQQRFHIKFSARSRMPLVVTLDPYFQHEALSLNLGTSAPVSLPADGGTAVASLFFWGDHATRVDEIRLVARAPKQKDAIAELVVPVKLSWVARDVPPRETAAWVAETQKNSGASAMTQLNESSRWLAFGAVIAAIALGGFSSRWLRKRRLDRRKSE